MLNDINDVIELFNLRLVAFLGTRKSKSPTFSESEDWLKKGKMEEALSPFYSDTTQLNSTQLPVVDLPTERRRF